MAKNHVGHVPCPCCDEDAEVREQKNGRAYVLCQSPVCGFQGFTRSSEADGHIRRKMRPIAAAIQEMTTTPQPEKKRSWFDDL